ncbi:glycoside hydrolase family 76 protein [Aspergillus saccharolyticus JOP 1030-1]|uniref:Mannan endo-1,6-alpha-mannosidase n=1 Tax=Aspergillus saccharolyticus JOP 1030-1 TaxID=1450539 RepID=A0A318ZHV2_9EURO|nr:hypothetical protein BP01DRAFT_415454 [Aspergillus saccharolyticus JOP 1030-1]PYH45964.1 hypothetical protein BP01DRAFT_415454 [Aspergillus saccharolyticus JOP 1030-1]
MAYLHPAYALARIAGTASAIELDIKMSSIKGAAATAAFNTVQHYNGNETGEIPGSIPDPWIEEARAYHQIGNNNYMPANWSSYMGNGDQMAWGLTAMTAAELDYPQDNDEPSWLALAEGNGGLFQVSARLARYTKNQTASVPLLDNETWNIADSTDADDDCTTQGNNHSAAYMYNLVTNGSSGLNGLLEISFDRFYPEKYGSLILSEALCEPLEVCNREQDLYKGIFASDLTFASLVAPYMSSGVSSRLQALAVGAAKQCTGGNNQTLCGRRWYSDEWDGTDKRWEQLSATSIVFSNLARFTEKDITLMEHRTADMSFHDAG